MLDPSSELTDSRSASGFVRRYIIFVIILGFGLFFLCAVLDRIRPIDFDSTGRFGPRMWLYESVLGYSGDNQIVTGDISGIHVFDLPHKKIFESREQLFSLVVSGHWLAYEDQPEQGPYQIKVRNLETGDEVALGTGGLAQSSPDISGNWVVFRGRSPNDDVGNIYAYDLTQGVRVPVAVEEGKVRCCPKVSNQWLIYLQGDAPWDVQRASIELRAHSLTIGEDFAIGPIPAPNNASFGTFHALDNDKVAWVRYEPEGTRSLHLYDLTKREDRVLPSELGYVGDVSITDKQHLVVVNNNGWKVIDWSQPQPAVIRPWGDNLDYLRAAGDYLVGKASRGVFVTQILP